MISSALKALLAFIRSKEAPKGYGQIYGGARFKPGERPLSTDVSIMTLNGVLGLQLAMLDGGSASSACGGYQFLRKTLLATIRQMGLTGKEVWTPDLQDRMAIYLMEGRGLSKYMAGKLTPEAFANNLAMEWASLPVVTAVKGSKGFTLKPGMSYYEGDGLNAALHDPKPFLALVVALKASEPYVPPPLPDVPAPEPGPEPQKPRGLLKFLIDLIASFFTRK